MARTKAKAQKSIVRQTGEVVKAKANSLLGLSKLEGQARADYIRKHRILLDANGEVVRKLNGEPRRRPRARAGTAALREIRRLQRGTEMLTARRPFQIHVRKISDKFSTKPLRWAVGAIDALRTATEKRMVDIFELANLGVIHAKRQTIMPSDLILARAVEDKIEQQSNKTTSDLIGTSQVNAMDLARCPALDTKGRPPKGYDPDAPPHGTRDDAALEEEEEEDEDYDPANVQQEEEE